MTDHGFSRNLTAPPRCEGLILLPFRTSRGPVEVGFVLLPGFTMLAFTSALDPLRIANQISGQALFRWQVMTEDGQPVACSNGLSIHPDSGLTAERGGWHVFVCGGVQPEATATAALADWVRARWRHGATVVSVCTGAYVLARAGLLMGRHFTLHWEHLASFHERFPDLSAQKSVLCIDDRILTSAGGVAATELALHLIETAYGAELAQAVMDMCLLAHRRTPDAPQRGSLAARVGTRHPALLRALQYIEAMADTEVDLDAVAAEISLCRRHLERLFRTHVGISPKQYLGSVRLHRGLALLSETDMSVLEVAIACGYHSCQHFSKCFRARYGVTPHRFANFRHQGAQVGTIGSKLVPGTL